MSTSGGSRISHLGWGGRTPTSWGGGGGVQLPMQLRFIKFVCQNERIGVLRGAMHWVRPLGSAHYEHIIVSTVHCMKTSHSQPGLIRTLLIRSFVVFDRFLWTCTDAYRTSPYSYPCRIRKKIFIYFCFELNGAICRKYSTLYEHFMGMLVGGNCFTQSPWGSSSKGNL